MDTQDLLDSLDSEYFDYRELAARAGYSVAQTYRRASQSGLRHPMSSRRRVLLERATWELTRGSQSLSQLAVDAGYSSLEGFSRAFKKAYGILPSTYRKLAPEEFRFGQRNGIHYQPGVYEILRQGKSMSFIERLFENHRSETHKLIDTINANPGISDTNLPLTNPFPWEAEPDDDTVASLLDRCCTMSGPWLHAIEGIKPPTFNNLHATLDWHHEQFLAFIRNVEKEGSWNVTFVDADCQPPEVFSYGSVIHFMVSFNEHARITLGQRLRAMGIKEVDSLPPQI